LIFLYFIVKSQNHLVGSAVFARFFAAIAFAFGSRSNQTSKSRFTLGGMYVRIVLICMAYVTYTRGEGTSMNYVGVLVDWRWIALVQVA